LRATRKLLEIPPSREGIVQGGARNQELEELRTKIEDLENVRLGDAKSTLRPQKMRLKKR